MLAGGPLGVAGGVSVFDGLPDTATCNALAVEAHTAYAESTRQECYEGDDAEGRGGVPRRALQTAPGGAVQDGLYASPGLHAFLAAQCGLPIVPSGGRGS